MPDLPGLNVDSPENSAPLLSLDHVSLRIGATSVLEHIDLRVDSSEIVTLIGPNGAGKSTLIKVALGLVTPDRGRVARRPGLVIGYVPQSVEFDRALPLTVGRFLSLDPLAAGRNAADVLDEVGAGSLADASMLSISGGEMRRVLLARALRREPDLLILDEPTAGVDVNGQTELYRLIHGIRDQHECGVLLVSHDLHIVMAATDRVLCLNRHLCCSGEPHNVAQHPEFIALFGDRAASQLAIYHHHHDHRHNLHGEVEAGHASLDGHAHG